MKTNTHAKRCKKKQRQLSAGTAWSTRPSRYEKKLGLSTPNYRHIPCLRFETGEKLSSQNMAPALANNKPAANLRNALWYLGAIPPTNILTVSGIIKWSIRNLNLSKLPEILVPFQNYDVTNGHPPTQTIKPSV